MAGMDKERILILLDEEIEFAKAIGVGATFVLGLQQAKQVIEDEKSSN